MHCIRGFIGKEQIIKTLADNWVNADIIPLMQEVSMVFLKDDLYDDIDELIHSNLEIDYDKFFRYFSPSIYELMRQVSHNGKLAYIETDYIGGIGSQSAILFENEIIKIKPHKTESFWDEKSNNYIHKPEGDKAINIVLNELGIYKVNGKDEFDSIGLANYRRI